MSVSCEEIMRIKPQIETKKGTARVICITCQEKEWIDGKKKRVWQKYLGTAETIEKTYCEHEKYTKFKTYEYGRTAALIKISEAHVSY